MEVLIKIGQLILSLSILVILHEFGHFAFARLFNTKVEKFYLFFNPWFSLFKYKKGDTEYGIGWLPLGGYVKISGMIDESMDREQLKKPAQPWEFRAKPAWQRLLIMLGGVLFNVIAGILIFITLVYIHGDPFIPKEEVNKHGIVAYELGREIGLQSGDKILNINGKEYNAFDDLVALDFLLDKNSYYTVRRNDKIMEIPIKSGIIEKLSEQGAQNSFIQPRGYTKIVDVKENSPAASAGLQNNDIIVALNGNTVFYNELSDIIKNHRGQVLDVKVRRPVNNENATDYTISNIQVDMAGDSLMGIMYRPNIHVDYKQFTLAQSVGEGTKRAFTTVYVQVKALSKIVTGEISAQKSLVGPIGIAGIFGGQWNWRRFWDLTGLISMILAIMNLLPIPALDGGHVVFLLYEMVTRRKPSEKFMEFAQIVGMILLLSLMVFVIGNDIRKLF